MPYIQDSLGGMTTKIIYFLASLICATLPIMNFYIWWGKKKKTVKKSKSIHPITS